ncbi:MAG: peroxidase family protein [Chloroflexota bacterium]
MICGRHGSKESLKEIYQPYQNGQGAEVEGRFTRLWDIDILRPDTSPKYLLAKLGKTTGLMDEGTEVNALADSNIPAGFTFVGQFIDHDITFDTVSQLDSQAKPGSIRNGRTPALDLDCLYAGGLEQSPFLYVPDIGQTPGGRMITQIATDRHTGEQFEELPRFPVADGIQRALIGDMRNDENPFVAQFHLAMLKFHNAFMNQGLSREVARDHVIHYYHRMILEDFLPQIINADLLSHVCTEGNCYYKIKSDTLPNMPVEFSVAAYRYGHSQVRERYSYNSNCVDVDLFELGAFRNVESQIDWKYLFELEDGNYTTMARQIDTALPRILMSMPKRITGKSGDSLAARNLLRGRTFRLPSGQSVAEKMAEDEALMGGEILPVNEDLREMGFKQTPLWYYCLEEAKVFGSGSEMGPVGGRIIAEVIVGLLEEYRNRTGKGLDYITDKSVPQAKAHQFQVIDLLKFAGVA